MLRGRKSDQSILVGGGWADTSATNTEVENDGSVVLLGNSSFCGGNSTVASDGINGVNTRIQRQRRTKDSGDLFTLKGGEKKPE